MLYSYKGQEPKRLPLRIRLSDGTTRTNPDTFSDQEIADAGFIGPIPIPEINSDTQNRYWNVSTASYVVVDKSQEELDSITATKISEQWNKIRADRDILLKEVDWRINRLQSQTRLGIAPVDDITVLDQYAQSLRDVTLQEDPFNIVWPSMT